MDRESCTPAPILGACNATAGIDPKWVWWWPLERRLQRAARGTTDTAGLGSRE